MNRINGSAQDSGESEFIDSFRSLGNIRTQQQQQQQQEEALQMPQQHDRTIEHSKEEEQHIKNDQHQQMPDTTVRATLVNAKQYRRILKRREARAKIEEYFNKKKMLNTKCCGVVRGQSARTTHPNCVE